MTYNTSCQSLSKKSVIFSTALSVRRHTRIDTNSKWQLVHPGFHFRLPGVPKSLVFLRTTTRFSRARTFTSNYRKLKLSRIDCIGTVNTVQFSRCKIRHQVNFLDISAKSEYCFVNEITSVYNNTYLKSSSKYTCDFYYFGSFHFFFFSSR